MKELSLHILDIAQNSISAKATLIKIEIEEDISNNLIKIQILDDGIGMSREFLKKVTDPFITTRKTRKVGLGLSLFKAASERCGGKFEINSELGKGTRIYATFERNNIDRAPLGNIIDTIITLIIANDQINYIYKHIFNGKEFIFNTLEIKNIIGKVPMTNPQIMDWISNYIKSGLEEIGTDLK